MSEDYTNITNSKFEARNSKQIQNSNDQNSKQKSFENLNLENSKIVSDFGFRYSSLRTFVERFEEFFVGVGFCQFLHQGLGLGGCIISQKA